MDQATLHAGTKPVLVLSSFLDEWPRDLCDETGTISVECENLVVVKLCACM